LHLAFYQLDRREQQACDGPASGATSHKSPQWQGFLSRFVDCCPHAILGYAIAEEQAARFHSSPNEWCANAAVETGETFITERLTKTVDGASIAWWAGIGLGLESDFDRVKGILYCLSDYTSNL
jgi:hypothetical protein